MRESILMVLKHNRLVSTPSRTYTSRYWAILNVKSCDPCLRDLILKTHLVYVSWLPWKANPSWSDIPQNMSILHWDFCVAIGKEATTNHHTFHWIPASCETESHVFIYIVSSIEMARLPPQSSRDIKGQSLRGEVGTWDLILKTHWVWVSWLPNKQPSKASTLQ